MGEVKLDKTPCNTIALRYKFIYKRIGERDILRFVSEKSKNIQYPTDPNDKKKDISPENVVYEDDINYLRSLDPKEWKSQDHYKVLGIPTLRILATEDIIKTAYRKKVLKHHPDKRKAQGENINENNDFFTCITMAYETLGNPAKRKAYDSVDPHFDNSLPSNSEIKNDFYKVCSYYFDLNARWSEKPNVPKLGTENSKRSEVEHFYNFWYDFKSWREYSYEDEEDKEKCQDRDERRYVDKLNKAERLRKKKEEMSRIRSLVDMAYANDPRIAKFKDEEKNRKLAAKKAKQTAAQAKKEEEERLLKEARLAKEMAESAEKARIEAKRQEREILKKALKKERKILRDLCKSNNYYTDDNNKLLSRMSVLEQICEKMSVGDLERINKEIKENGEKAFMKAIKEMESIIEKERQEILNYSSQKNTQNKSSSCIQVIPEWNEENLQLLIKAVNVFPVGTNQRWEVVANFINQHGKFEGSSKFTAKMVLAKAKDLQNADFSKNNLKEMANKRAFNNFKKEVKNGVLDVNESGISKNLENVKLNDDGDSKTTDNPWTTSEQQLLEQALKSYSTSTPDRWDKIAECIPNRSKKECMRRYKQLVETVKAKKAAQASVNTK